MVLLDILLPDIDGLEVCREIQREADVPVIFITSKDDPTDVGPFSPGSEITRAGFPGAPGEDARTLRQRQGQLRGCLHL
ncbi:MAG TPA: response regulator [Firmicutes bacterium]|nr:response regulator [Bacillota bacterium]